MGAVRKIQEDGLLARAQAASEAALSARVEARGEVVRVVRALEAAVVAAVRSDKLRGMRNVLPRHVGTFQAARVQTNLRRGLDEILTPGTWTLVIDKAGSIRWLAYEPGVATRDELVGDEEIHVEDLEPVIRTYRAVLERHAERAGESCVSYQRASELARRLGEVVAA